MTRPAPTSLVRAALAVATLVLLASGCITPSIPIPPPDPERMAFQVDADLGVGTFAYPPDENYAQAIVYVFNRDQQRGIITVARDDGSVGPTEPLPIASGDNVLVSFETEEQVVSTCVVITEGAPSGICD